MRDGLVGSTAYPEVPARVGYELTGFGPTLDQLADTLAEWVATYTSRSGVPGRTSLPRHRVRGVLGTSP